MKPHTSTTQLPRVLGPVLATALVVGTVIGSGVFRKPYAVAGSVHEFGPAILVWVLVGLLALFGALTLAEVATLFPRAGGNYVFLREGYGRIMGFLWGWVEFWIIRSGSIAALAGVFTDSLHDLLRQARDLPPGTEVIPFWTRQGLTVTVIAALTLVNIRGVKWGGYLQLVITLVKVGSLLAVVALPFIVLGLVSEPRAIPTTANMQPVWPEQWSAFSWSGFGAAVVGVIWAYHGWMNIAPVAEEVKNPSRNIPLSLLAGVGIVIVLYLGANVAYALVLNRDEVLALKNTPTAAGFAEKLLGPVGGLLMSAAIMISVFGALNGNILVGPRLLYAMAEDRLAPRALGALHPVYKTPALATVVMSAWSAALVVGVAALFRAGVFGNPDEPGAKVPFDVITDFAMFGAVALETLAVESIFVFRQRYPDADRPYRCLGYPVVPVVYGFLMLAFWLNMYVTKPIEAYTGLGFMVAGAVLYLVALRGRGER